MTGGPTWALDVRHDHPVTRRLGEGDGDGIPDDGRPLTGTAADLYLALWNRGGTVEDPTDLLPTEWREPARSPGEVLLEEDLDAPQASSADVGSGRRA